MLTPVYVFPAGMGDAVMALAVAENYYAQTGTPLHIGHTCAEIFEHDPRVVCHPEYAFWNLTAKSEDEARTAGYQLISLFYFNFRQVTSNYWISYGASGNLVATLCSQVGLSGHLKISPRMILTEEERALARLAEGKIVVISSGVASYKSWGIEKMQAVVDACPTQSFIQIGMSSDPLLQNVEDMRGKYSLRQLAGILSGARLFLGPVGGMMHLARSVDCPALVLLPSFESSNWLYSEFDYVEPAHRCHECEFRQSPPGCCSHQEQCMDISVEQVIHKLTCILSSWRRHLVSEYCDVTACPTEKLNLYYKMLSFVAGSLTIGVYTSRGHQLLNRQLRLDNHDYVMALSPDFSEYSDVFISINIPRHLGWVYAIQSISLVRNGNDNGDKDNRDLSYRLRGALSFRKNGKRYLYQYRTACRLYIQSMEYSGKESIRLQMSCVALEQLFPKGIHFPAKIWWLHWFVCGFYTVERLGNAVKNDSWGGLFQRCFRKIIRLLSLNTNMLLDI